MEKGDCVLLDNGELKYVLILHHSIEDKKHTNFGFILVGRSFNTIPNKKEIESSGILGDKYQNDTSDLINSSMRSQQKFDSSTFYTGVKYDVITLPKTLFTENNSVFQIIANVKLNPKFYPMPNSYSRLNDFNEVCITLREKILKKDPKKINWDTIYDSYPLKELIIE